MEALKQALEELTHVQVVYVAGKDWYFNKPNFEHKELTRDEVLGLKKETKAEKKERERLEAEAEAAEQLKAEAKAQAEEEARKEAELKAEADSNEAQD